MDEKRKDTLSEFLNSEREWLNSLIEQYPRQIPIKPLAEHWGCDPGSIRAAIEAEPTFGVFWHKAGRANHAYLIPTGLFVQWYCKAKLV